MNASRPALDVDVRGTIGDVAISAAFRTALEPTVVVGPNGAGKTTLLMMILGAVKPRDGHVRLGDERLYDAAAGVDVPIEGRRIGFVPQRYGLFPHLDVRGNVAFGLAGATRAERLRAATAALEELGIAALATRRTARLSGGEAQRVALARALVHRPDALLLDEPLAALDAAIRQDTRRFLADRLRALGVPTVIVTHDRADAEAFGGEIVVMERGAVVQRGRLPELGARPATAFVARFTGVRNGDGDGGGSRSGPSGA
jgi:ABC-type Fe3+/spermidine/putrescine transport system ATPase subunit